MKASTQAELSKYWPFGQFKLFIKAASNCGLSNSLIEERTPLKQGIEAESDRLAELKI